MLKFLYNYQVVTQFSPMVASHFIMLRCLPTTNEMQRIDEHHFVISPSFRINRGTDAFGNRILYGGTTEQHSALAYVSTGIVSQGEYIIRDYAPAPYYRIPSRLTMPNEETKNIVIQGIDNPALSPYEKALLISNVVHNLLEYKSGTTNNNTTATEALEMKCGVCQDFAHLMLLLCRQHGITARYVNGFIIGEGATHAWVEVHDGYAWRGIDPTHDTFIYSGYIKIAHGRDALDCNVDRGTFIGTTEQKTSINVTMVQL